MGKFILHIKKALVTVFTLGVTVLVSTFLHQLSFSASLIPMLFVLSVFIVSLVNKDFFWGVIASIASVLAVNYAFTAPFNQFNFSISDNLFSAFIMMVVAVTTVIMTLRINRLEKMRAEIEKEKLRANLLRAISHDLRTPLTTIYGSSSAISDNFDTLSREQKLKLLNDITEDSESMIRLVENLLSVTKVSEESVKLKLSATVLEELIDNVIVKFKKNFPDNEVSLKLPDDFVSIEMDSVLITQVLLNLLENAVLHAKGMTELKLKVELIEDKAEFSVEDNGCGLNKGLSIEQNSPPADGGRNNLGIGLSLCSAIIKAHGSNLISIDKPGGGAIFKFALKTEVIDFER